VRWRAVKRNRVRSLVNPRLLAATSDNSKLRVPHVCPLLADVGAWGDGTPSVLDSRPAWSAITAVADERDNLHARAQAPFLPHLANRGPALSHARPWRSGFNALIVHRTCLLGIHRASTLRDYDERPRYAPLFAANAERTGGSSHDGDCNSGIGFAWNRILHCLAIHRAQVLDFFLRALSVEIPVPAYICR